MPGAPNDVRARTVSLRGSVSSEASGPAPSAGGGGGEPSASNHGRLPPPEQPHNVPPNRSQPRPGPVTFAGPDAPPLQQDSGNGGPIPGHPDTRQIPPSQGQGQSQGPGQPPFLYFHQNGQPMNPPHPIPVPVFGRLYGQMGQAVGPVRRGSFTVSARMDVGPGVRQLPPGYLMTYPPPGYPQMQHPQMPPQMNPQIPPHAHPQMPPQMQTQGPMPMNWGAPPGPPPPYSGPSQGSGEPAPGTNQAGSSTNQRGASRTSGTFAVLQDSNEGPEDDCTELDGSVPRREATGRAPTRANPARKARPTRLCESD